MIGVNLSGAEFGKGDRYGYDYAYPSSKDLTFYADQGVTLVRLPVKWERLQHDLGGPIDPTELGRLQAFLAKAEKAGVEVIIDLHNFGTYDGKRLGSADVPTTALADFWAKLATAVGDSDAVAGYDLMNEPHGFKDPMTWPTAAQQATDAIRATGDTHAIYVEGENWAGAANWGRDNPYLDVKDPLDQIIYEAHVYFDRDKSGTYKGTYDSENAYPDIGEKRIHAFVAWLEKHDAKGFIGEFSVPNDDPRWQVVLDNFLAAMEKNGLSGTYWGAGTMFNGYPQGLIDKSGVPTESLATLLDHVATIAVPAPATAAPVPVPVAVVPSNILFGTAGDDMIVAPDAARLVDGGAGSDTIDFSTGLTSLAIDLSDATRFRAVENAIGGAGNDVLTGNGGANRLDGGAGADRIDGGAGADSMAGGKGNDIYFVDTIADQIVEAAREGTDTVEAGIDFTLGRNVEALVLSGTADLTGTGNGSANVLTGNSRANGLFGMTGDDTLFGGAGNDRLDGGADRDTLDGGSGDDVLAGRGGRDVMTGGSGDDRFAFVSTSDSTSSARDRILDFDPGHDLIDLSLIDANTRWKGGQSFTWVGQADFGRTAGELRYEAGNGFTLVEGDINGDGKAEFSLRLDEFSGVLHASDFIL